MIRTSTIYCMIILSTFFLSACWDSQELNDRAIELGWGIDDAMNNKIQISSQVVIPSKIGGKGEGGGGSQGKSFLVATGIGKDTLEAVQKMQAKLSRKIFRGQRRVIVIGEQLARKGIKDILDTYTRDPSINLLADIFVVKGNTAKSFLQTSYPLENIPSVGALKEYNQIGATKEVSFLNFLLSANSDGRCPIMPVVSTDGKKGFQMAGNGIFNKDLKLIGFLNADEGKILRWITGDLQNTIVTSTIPNGNGTVSLDLNTVNSKIQPMTLNNKIKILVTLTGQGTIRENNTGFDLTDVKNIALVQNTLDQQAEKDVLRTITKVQKVYGTDIFGFGDAIKRKNLQQWNSLKKNWSKEFSEVEVTVKADLTVRKIGVTGPSLIQ
ncbi:Ger(x)C family spore germination protein [Neobacillus cucumis]|uniref:Ger(x)C family spore germination protein n=1 Tax=Neobacillus cucumis TaxID=1740721 RepID=UPI002E219F74|nr:Ger(x)C family spore germination protein [Neobacillus cucumis]